MENRAFYRNLNGVKFYIEFGLFDCEFFLGLLSNQWKISRHDERFKYILDSFRGSLFRYESDYDSLRPSGDNEVRISLKYFDCTTLLYTVLAISSAKTIDDFFQNYVLIRYHKPIRNGSFFIDNNHDVGNIYDFVCESVFQNSVGLGLLKDISSNICPSGALVELSALLTRRSRSRHIDKDERIISPKTHPEVYFRHSFISSSCAQEIDFEKVSTGDIVFFSKASANTRNDLIVSHIAFVYKIDDRVHFFQPSKNYLVSDQANKQSPLEQQIGVDLSFMYAGDEYTTTVDGTQYYGYRAGELEVLPAYAARNFTFIAVYRMTPRG